MCIRGPVRTSQLDNFEANISDFGCCGLVILILHEMQELDAVAKERTSARRRCKAVKSGQ